MEARFRLSELQRQRASGNISVKSYERVIRSALLTGGADYDAQTPKMSSAEETRQKEEPEQSSPAQDEGAINFVQRTMVAYCDTTNRVSARESKEEEGRKIVRQRPLLVSQLTHGIQQLRQQ